MVDIPKHLEVQELTGHIQEILQHATLQRKSADEIIAILQQMFDSFQNGRIRSEISKNEMAVITEEEVQIVTHTFL